MTKFTARCKPITIFEGPDGAGKTTAAQRYAHAIGARYVHCGAFKGVENIARLYVEAMLPALHGYQPVVLDRSWLSEHPYGVAYRDGRLRISVTTQRQLERLAMRCGAAVVLCQPPDHVTHACFTRRSKLEMLDDLEQLQTVIDLYHDLPMSTSLPVWFWDYTDVSRHHDIEDLMHVVDTNRAQPHLVNVLSAGAWNALVLIVGDKFGPQKSSDPLYQWPFGSFSNLGCSQWLTRELEDNGISEHELLWVNSDQAIVTLLEALDVAPHIVALGDAAEERLLDSGLGLFSRVPHPQYWKRFQRKRTYDPLIDAIKTRVSNDYSYTAP